MLLIVVFSVLSAFLVVLLHELGHLFVATRYGARPDYIQLGFPTVFRFSVKGLPVRLGLIPFAGWQPAVVGLSLRQKLAVLLAGSFANFLFGLTLVLAVRVFPSPYLAVLGVFSLFVAVSNLLPIPPCDGWLIVEAIAEHRGRPLSYRFRVIVAAIFYGGLVALILLSQRDVASVETNVFEQQLPAAQSPVAQ